MALELERAGQLVREQVAAPAGGSLLAPPEPADLHCYLPATHRAEVAVAKFLGEAAGRPPDSVEDAAAVLKWVAEVRLPPPSRGRRAPRRPIRSTLSQILSIHSALLEREVLG